MSFNPIARAVALATVGTSLMIPALAQADFVKDSKASLSLRNFYHERDLNVSDSATERNGHQWGQAFRLDAKSGYTEGTIGLGVDVMGLLGATLSEDNDHNYAALKNIGALTYHRGERDPESTYGELRGTLKAKFSKTELKHGTLMPNLPVISPSDTRLLPNHYKGTMATSGDIENLTLDIGRVTAYSARNDSSYRDLNQNDLGTNASSDNFDFLSANYKWNAGLSTSYSAGELEDVYKQHILNVIHTLPIAEGQSLKSDIRYATTKDDGAALRGALDNKAFGAMLTYNLKAHKLGLAYQRISGDGAYQTVTGAAQDNPYLVNYIQNRSFELENEKSWQVRYDYDFTSMGVPGLTFMTRLVKGSGFDEAAVAGNDHDGKEWERNIDVKYVFPQGTLKGVGVQLRNAAVRSNSDGANTDFDENRLILSYTLPLL